MIVTNHQSTTLLLPTTPWRYLSSHINCIIDCMDLTSINCTALHIWFCCCILIAQLQGTLLSTFVLRGTVLDSESLYVTARKCTVLQYVSALYCICYYTALYILLHCTAYITTLYCPLLNWNVKIWYVRNEAEVYAAMAPNRGATCKVVCAQTKGENYTPPSG